MKKILITILATMILTSCIGKTEEVKSPFSEIPQKEASQTGARIDNPSATNQ